MMVDECSIFVGNTCLTKCLLFCKYRHATMFISDLCTGRWWCQEHAPMNISSKTRNSRVSRVISLSANRAVCLSNETPSIHTIHQQQPIMCLIWASRPRRVVVVDLVFVAAAAVVLVLVANWNLSTTCSRNHLSRHIVKGDLTHISLALK